MEILFLVLFVILAVLLLIAVLFTKKGEYITSSYKVNPFIDDEECIELYICDQYLKEKHFFVSYKYSAFLEEKNDIKISFIQIPVIHKKPRIQDVFINNEKINK